MNLIDIQNNPEIEAWTNLLHVVQAAMCIEWCAIYNAMQAATAIAIASNKMDHLSNEMTNDPK